MEKLRKATDILNFEIINHIVYGDAKDYYSFRDYNSKAEETYG